MCYLKPLRPNDAAYEVSKQIARKPTVPNAVSGVWFGDLCVSPANPAERSDLP